MIELEIMTTDLRAQLAEAHHKLKEKTRSLEQTLELEAENERLSVQVDELIDCYNEIEAEKEDLELHVRRLSRRLTELETQLGLPPSNLSSD